MIIHSDSIFRKIPVNLIPVQVQMFDGIRYSIDIAELSYERLIENLYQTVFSKEKLKPSVSQILSDCCTIINNLTIFFNILNTFSEISKDDPIFENYNSLKFLRHTNQHLDERINEVSPIDDIPLLGVLSWYAQESENSNKGIISSLYIGTFTSKKNINPYIVNPAGKLNNQKINHIEFTNTIKINNKYEQLTLNITRVMENLKFTINHFEKTLKSQLENYKISEYHTSDFLINLFVEKHI